MGKKRAETAAEFSPSEPYGMKTKVTEIQGVRRPM